MKKNARPAAPLLFLPLVAALAACGGGGGGGGGTTQVRPTPPDESVVTTPPPPADVTTISGPTVSESITYRFNTSDQKFTEISAASTPSLGGVSTVGYTDAGTIVKLTLDPGSGPLEFTRFGPSGVSPLLTLAENDTHVALVPSGAALQALGWNYQSFGVWEPGVETGTGTSGVVSFGRDLTAVGDIPTQGSATYKGILGGQYVNTEGVDHVLYADLQATADFAARTISLSTTKTLILNERNLASGDYQDVSGTLALDGELTIARDANDFSGEVRTANGLRGSSQGRFYGPDAAELGGVGAVQAASGVESIQFAYGAKKQ